MNFPFLATLLTPDEWDICLQVAKARLEEQRQDYLKGDGRAAYSNGKRQRWDARSEARRLEDNFLGAIGELLATKAHKCIWPKAHGQYKGNRCPDLFATFNGQQVRVEARMTRYKDTFIVRQTDLTEKNAILSYSNIFIGWIGWIEFNKLPTIIQSGQCELLTVPGKVAWTVPNKFLSKDISCFGDNNGSNG